MLDFRVDTFLTVCESMNFTQAAQILHITQPAVSQHIHYLENRYGVKLFTYQNKHLDLTPEGKLLRDAAMTMKHDEFHLKEQILQKRERKLRFGATLTIGEFVMPSLLIRYLHSHPETAVDLTVANTQKLLKRLDRGLTDFALIEGFYDRTEYDGLPYREERYIAVCASCMSGLSSSPTLEELFSAPLILREPGSGTREILERFLESRNLTLQSFPKRMEINNIHAIKSLVEAGCGFTFLYESAVREELAANRLAQIPLADFDLRHDFTFVWRKNSMFAPSYREMFERLLGESGLPV